MRHTQGMTEAHDLGKCLWAHADGFVECAAQMPFAHPEVDGDGPHAGA
jgi:hypothetical protein